MDVYSAMIAHMHNIECVFTNSTMKSVHTCKDRCSTWGTDKEIRAPFHMLNTPAYSHDTSIYNWIRISPDRMIPNISIMLSQSSSIHIKNENE